MARCHGNKNFDLMPTGERHKRKPETQGWQEQLSIVAQLNQAFRGKDLRGESKDLG